MRFNIKKFRTIAALAASRSELPAIPRRLAPVARRVISQLLGGEIAGCSQCDTVRIC